MAQRLLESQQMASTFTRKDLIAKLNEDLARE